MKRLLIVGVLFCWGCANTPIKQAAIDMNNFLQSRIRAKVISFPQNSKVEVFFKHEDPMFGIFKTYQVYTDTIWVQPDGARGLFSDVAYNLNDLQDIIIVSKLKNKI